jgi:hypothetical protein
LSANPYRASRLGRVTGQIQAGAWVRYVRIRQGAQGERGEPGGERLPHLLDIGQDVGGRGHHDVAVVTQLVQRGRVGTRPRGDHVDVTLDVELQAPRPVAEPERLVRILARGSEQDRADGQLGDLVAVPLDHVGQQRNVLEQRIVVGRVPAGDQAGPDLRA